MTSFLLQQLAHKRCSCRSTVYLWLKVKRFTRYVAKNSGCLQGILISCTNYPESLHQKICQTDKFIVSIVDRLCFFSLWLVLYAALQNISLCTIAYYVFFQYLPETDMLEDSLLSPYLGLIAVNNQYMPRRESDTQNLGHAYPLNVVVRACECHCV